LDINKQRSQIQKITIIIIALLITSTCFAATIHVPSEELTIQDGVDAALENDTVLVASGTYTGPGNRDILLNAKNIVLISESGPSATIINCEGDSTTPHRGFTFTYGVGTTTVVDGFTIKNGYGLPDPYYIFSKGGGMLCDNASPTVKNCIFSNNDGGQYGGAVFCYNSQAKFINCTFVKNSAKFGSCSASLSSTEPILENCIIAFSPEGVSILGYASLSCCNIYANIGGDWIWEIASQYGQNGNISADPLFCDIDNEDFSISYTSPCSPYINASCELIGALKAGCHFDVPQAFNIQYGNPPNSDTVLVPTPMISWTYLDTATTVQTACEIEVGSDNDWNVAEMWASGEVLSNDNQITYAGLPFQHHTHYYARIRVDNGSGWGVWKYSEFYTILVHTFKVPEDFSTIQEAIDTAINLDTIVVADGIYTGDGNRDIDFHGKNIYLTSENGASSTIIDCQGSDADPHLAFLFTSGESQEATVNGFKIINGSGLKETSTYKGGAIFCDLSSPTITQCIFEDNTDAQNGGAIYCRGSNMNIIECEFRNNVAEQAACIYIDETDKAVGYYEVNINTCLMEGNSAEGSNAGAILISPDSITVNISSSVFYNNIAGRGDAICAFGGTVNLHECTIVGNRGPGSGILLFNAVLSIDNSIIAYGKMGPAIGCSSDFTIDINCTDIFGNAGGDWVDGISHLRNLNGNLHVNPLFCNAATGDFTLFSHSPCLQGNNECGIQMGALGEGCSGYNYKTWIVNAVRSGTAATIQAAIDSCVNGDTVLVRDGTYTGNGNWDIDFWGKDIVVVSENGASSTIIDCQEAIFITHRAFRFCNGESNNLLVQGFTIKEGLAPSAKGKYMGGAISISNSSPIIRNCNIINNMAYDHGGAISGFETDVIIENCMFSNNTADHAAAIYLYGSSTSDSSQSMMYTAHINNCRFIENTAETTGTSTGGAMTVQNGKQCLSLNDCIFQRNKATYGSALICHDASLFVSNCTFVGNQAMAANNGVIVGYEHLNLELENCIIAYNKASQAVYCYYGTLPDISYSDIYGNGDGDWVGCIEGMNGSNGNISDAPLFCDTLFIDYTLSPFSPCVGTGVSGTNMGAFGVGCGVYCGDMNHDAVIGVSDAVYLINYIFIEGPAPDPISIADVNCDTHINLVDIIYVINHVFRSGYTPCDTDGDSVPDC
jgi:Dockerin type I domain/Chlamydia polymorphic membrane protein (Chlamydia_PMP) repeat